MSHAAFIKSCSLFIEHKLSQVIVYWSHLKSSAVCFRLWWVASVARWTSSECCTCHAFTIVICVDGGVISHPGRNGQDNITTLTFAISLLLTRHVCSALERVSQLSGIKKLLHTHLSMLCFFERGILSLQCAS